MCVRALNTPDESVVDLKRFSPHLRSRDCDTYRRTTQPGRQIARDQHVVTLSRNAFVTVAAGLLVVVGAVYLDATDNVSSALRVMFAHVIWATTFSGQTLQRRNS
jgi:hypothetical protein